MFSEILQAIAASDHEHRAWRMNIADSLEKERVERRKAQQEKEREMHQDIRELLWKQTHMLQTLVDLQVQQSWTHLPLQPIEDSILGPPYTPPPQYFTWQQGSGHYPYDSTPGDTKGNHSFAYTDLGKPGLVYL
ncbi:unnamed protein product [Caretta caretta]